MSCVWAVYYKQIRKSEQRPPLHLRAADLVPAPDPGVSHGNSQVQATIGLTNAGEATGTPHRSTRAQARNIEAREQGEHLDYLDVVSEPSLIEAIIRPS